jgi:D-sedoheptulose 7-phosphate isomerase
MSDPGAPGAPQQLHAEMAEHLETAHALSALVPEVEKVARLLIHAFAEGGTLYTFGNGGSAADAQHLTGELIGRYKRERRPLPAVTLSTDATVTTCIANDYAYDEVFSRQVRALARPGDVVAGFSTSGTSPNVVRAMGQARIQGVATVLFAGGDGGAALQHSDHALVVPSTATARIQEMHTLMLHMISETVDAWAAGEEPGR